MKKLTTLRTGLAYDKVIKDVDRRELRTGSIEKNWDNYIDIARGLLSIAEVSRMAVAEVAMRAIVMKNGGDRHSINWKTVGSRLTTKAFANSIGVKPNTLWLWIKIKTRVYDSLNEKDRKRFKHDDAEKTFKLVGSKKTLDPEKVQEVYSALSNRSAEQRIADNAIKNLMSVRKVVLLYHKYLNDRQKEGLKVGTLEILKLLEEPQRKGTEHG